MDSNEIEVIVKEILQKYHSASPLEQQKIGVLNVEKLWLLTLNSVPEWDHPLSRKPNALRGHHTATIRSVPSLFRVALLESRITSKVMAALVTRPVVTIYELEIEICRTEGVPTFSCLGMGHGLSEWPLVRQYFQCGEQKIFPVSSEMVLDFITFHPDASSIREGIGDVRDVMNAFRFVYEREILPSFRHRAQSSRNGAVACTALPSRVPNVRALGVHIHNLAELVTSLRQEHSIGKSTTLRLSRQLLPQKSLACAANQELYDSVVQALDLTMLTAPENPRKFSVAWTPAAMRKWVIPPSWRKYFEENSPGGGIRLEFHVGPCEARLIADSPTESNATNTPQSVSVAPSKSHARRARRGMIVSDDSTDLTLGNVKDREEISEIRDSGYSEPVPPQKNVNLDIVEPIASSSVNAVKDCTPMTDWFLHAENAKAQGILNVLSRIQPGDRLPLDFFLTAFSVLSEVNLSSSFWNSIKSKPYIPLFVSEGADSATGSILCSVREMATPLSVSWRLSSHDKPLFAAPALHTAHEIDWNERKDPSYLITATSSATLEEHFGRSLALCYPETLRSFFVGVAEVSPYATLSAFLGYWRNAHREGSPLPLVQSRYFSLLAKCAEEDFRSRLMLEKGRPVESVEKCLAEMLRQLPSDSSNLFLFPYGQSWWFGADGLYYCGPRYQGCSGLYLQPVGLSTPPLPCVCLESDADFILERVLQHFGLRSVPDAVKPFIGIEQPALHGNHGDESSLAASLHAVINAVTPCVQLYLQRYHPLLYAISSSQIRERLRLLRVVLGYNLTVSEVLRDTSTGSMYEMKQTPRLKYVPMHHTLYGVVECFTSPVLSDVVTEIFLPVFPSLSVRAGLHQLLMHLFSLAFDAEGQVLQSSCDSGVMQGEMERIKGSVVPDSVETSCFSSMADEDPPWELSPTPSRVQRHNFPPGTNALFTQQCWSFGAGELGAVPEKVGQKRQRTATGAERFGVPPSAWDNFFEASKNPHTVLQKLTERVSFTEEDSLPSETANKWSSPKSSDGIAGLKRYDSNDVAVSTGQVASSARAIQEEKTRRYAQEAEKFVWEAVRNKYRDDPTIEVLWLNQEEELGEPYDIVVYRQNPQKEKSSSERRIICFLEVKSTCSSNRHDFELSLNELIYAARFGNAYCVCRVYGASTSALRKMRFTEYSDLLTSWRRGRLTLTGDIRVIPSTT